MSDRITPGRYLAKRRRAAGLSIEALPLPLDALQAIEADVRFRTDVELQALQWSFDFDITILIAIARGIVPRLCRSCGCSEDDACVGESGACFWIEQDLCSACAGEERFAHCECGADVDTEAFGECHACGRVVA
jgi:hypothetical protein